MPLPARLRAWVLLALLAAAAPPAAAQAPVCDGETELAPGAVCVPAGEPGVVILLHGVDVASAHGPRSAVAVSPDEPANMSIALTPPEGDTWRIAAFRVGLVIGGPDAQPPGALTQETSTEIVVPAGVTVYVNRTVDVSSVKRLGAGVFLMQVSAVSPDGGDVFAQRFYVHVTGNPFLTAAGVAVTAVSVATGYGLWKLAQDLWELKDARERHRRRRAEEEAARRAGEKGVVAAAREVTREADRLERRLVLRWTATGLGLGGVALSWAGFLGYVAFDAMETVLTAAELGGYFLAAALILVAARRHARRRRAAQQVRTIVPEAGPAPAPAPDAPPAEAAPPRAR